jgi:hypothetical protein
LRKKPTAPRARVKPVRWEIIRPAQILAVVEAPDKDSALRVAAERLNLRLVDLSRLIVRRA